MKHKFSLSKNQIYLKKSKLFSLFCCLHSSSICILVQLLVEYSNSFNKRCIQRCSAQQSGSAYQREATLLKKRLRQRCLSVNFAKFLRTSFDRTPPDDCLLCLSVNHITSFIEHVWETDCFMYKWPNFNHQIQ